MEARELEKLTREELILYAKSLGISRASLLSRAELIDEILRRKPLLPNDRGLRGLFEAARELVANVVERGFDFPEAAALIRGPEDDDSSPPPPKKPLATLTLAEIYASQGHQKRALAIVSQILEEDPNHAAARALHEKLRAGPELEPDDADKPEEPAAEAPPKTDEAQRGEGDEAEEEGEDTELPTSASAPLTLPPPSPRDTDEEPAPMLDDEPLPPHYEVDELVALPVDPQTLYLYWELCERSFVEAKARGALLLRIASIVPSWEGPRVEIRDIEVQAKVGDYFVRDLPPGAILRAALGYRAAGEFQPIAIGAEVEAPTSRKSLLAATDLALYTRDEGALPIESPTTPKARAYARAALRYRQKLTAKLILRMEAAGAKEDISAADSTEETLSELQPSSPTEESWRSE